MFISKDNPISYNTVPTDENKEQIAYAEKNKVVIPIIFIPGIMGSNLRYNKTKKSGKTKGTRKMWWGDSELILAAKWGFRNAAQRRRRLNAEKVIVDYRGKVTDAAQKEIDEIKEKAKKEQQAVKDLFKDNDDFTALQIFTAKDKIVDSFNTSLVGTITKNIKEISEKGYATKIFGENAKLGLANTLYVAYLEYKSRKDDIKKEIDKTIDDVRENSDKIINEVRNVKKLKDIGLRDLEFLSLKAKIQLERNKNIKKAIQNNVENKHFGTRTDRGWGSVFHMTYNDFLVNLQTSLFDKSDDISKTLTDLIDTDSKTPDDINITQDMLVVTKEYHFAVHAHGYNWLDTNANSAQELKKLIDGLPDYYKKLNKTVSEKVILVTHSMGGLVARYYTEVLCGQEKVYGVVHGVMPDKGAVATYTRMKQGTEVRKDLEEDFTTRLIGKLKSTVTRQVLSRSAKHMVAVCAQSPGPLELLPTKEYGIDWLSIKEPDGNVHSYPKEDPFNEIYLNRKNWWGLCEPHLINPLNKENDPVKIEEDWKNYTDMVLSKVIVFQKSIANKYHPNSYAFYGEYKKEEKKEDNKEEKKEDKEYKYVTYETAKWSGSLVEDHKVLNKYKQQVNIPYLFGDQDRLDLKEKKSKRTLKLNNSDDKNAEMVRRYTLEPLDGKGDTTVPVRSACFDAKSIKLLTSFEVDHETAFDNPKAREFTFKSLVKIIQDVKTTSANS